jgi:hypothetical protein
MRITLLCLVLLAACGGSGRSPTADAASPGDAAGDGSPGSGSACGGFAHLPCSATQYCDYADNGCGIGDQTGTCKPRPAMCPLATPAAPAAPIAMTAAAAIAAPAVPTCACDNQVYGGECDAHVSGVDLNAHGTCPLDAAHFACGYTQCALATQYCRREPHTTGPETFTCAALPQPACSGTPSCACLSGERCSSACTGDARAGLTLACAPTA